MLINLILAICFFIIVLSPIYLYNKINKMKHLNLEFKLEKCRNGHKIPRRSADAVQPSIGRDYDSNCQTCIQNKLQAADQRKMAENKKDFQKYKECVQFTVRPIA